MQFSESLYSEAIYSISVDWSKEFSQVEMQTRHIRNAFSIIRILNQICKFQIVATLVSNTRIF